MRIAKPLAIELDYVQRMMAWMLWRPSDCARRGSCGAARHRRGRDHALLPSQAAHETTRSRNQRFGDRRLQEWFRLPEDDARLTVLHDDAARWVTDPVNRATVQVLCVDLYDHDAAAPVLDDEAFYAACRETLVPGGLMSGESIRPRCQLRGKREAHRRRVRRRQRVEPASDARGQHRRRRRTRRGPARSCDAPGARRTHRSAFRTAGTQVAAHDPRAGVARSAQPRSATASESES